MNEMNSMNMLNPVKVHKEVSYSNSIQTPLNTWSYHKNSTSEKKTECLELNYI